MGTHDVHLLLDALSELSVVHEEPPSNGGRAEVPEGPEQFKGTALNLPT